MTRLLSMSGGSTSGTAKGNPKDSKGCVMPITVLSGFLGAGKTTFLQHAVTNADGKRYGLVVNDMATVNVDSKLIKKQTSGSDIFDGIDTMELQNGCVCCTLAEDMMASVSRLVQMADNKQEPYDHIIVECSGIAEPRNIRDLFQEAEDYGLPLLSKIKLDTLVTIVDAAVFHEYFGSDSDIATNPALAFRDTDDSPDKQIVESRKVTELLLEQVECADIVLINKVDLLEDPDVQVPLIQKVISSMNPTAEVRTCERGAVMPQEVLGKAGAAGAADWGILDEHRKLVTAVKTASCSDPDCYDPSHAHDHSHNHSHSSSSSASSSCTDSECTDSTHNHDHAHNNVHSSSSMDPTCADSSHPHDHCHDHGKRDTADCSDPTCTDSTHNHDHSHSHSHSHDNEEMTTARERFGITSFVYSRRRPFHPGRMSVFLQGLGKLSVSGMEDVMDTNIIQKAAPGIMSAAKSLLRSKGFVWIATSRTAAYFMSHAGQYLEMVVLGRWWADIPQNEWPAGAEEEIKIDFDPNLPSHGDRRQELVFIGQFASEKERQSLEEVLDSCLLTDEEFAEYERVAPEGDEALRNLFFAQDKI